MEHKKHKGGFFRTLGKIANPLNSLKMLNPLHTIHMAQNLRHHAPVFGFSGINEDQSAPSGMHFDSPTHRTPSQSNKTAHDVHQTTIAQNAQSKILQKAKPFMKQYLTLHGVDRHHEHPVHLAGQVAMVKANYETDFKKKIRGQFLSENAFQRFINSDDYLHQLDQYENELEKGKGFLGFDGGSSTDEHGFLPLIALGGALLKNKKVQSVIKGVGNKVLGAVSKKAKEKITAKKLSAKAGKSTAQAQAISAGVPPEVVAQHTANLSPDKATMVANDLRDVYSSTVAPLVPTALASETSTNPDVKKYIMIALGVALAGVLVLVIVKK